MAPNRRGKGEGTLFKRADGYWIGAVELPTTDGKRRQKRVSSRSRNTALQKLRDLRKEIDAGRIPTTSRTTVQRWMDHWLETIHGPTIKPTTYKSYADTIRLYINPTIGAKRIDRLTPEHVRQMHRTLQATSTRNAQKAHQVLQRALKDATNEGLAARNVAQVVRKPKHTAQRRDAFSFDVARHIIAAAVASGDEMWAARWIAGFMTGARESELLGLTWDRVDLDRALMDLSWQLQQLQKTHGCGQPVDGKYPCGKVRVSACPQAHWDFPPGFEHVVCERSLVWTRPKSAAGLRAFPIRPALAAVLARLKTIDGYNPHQLVFHHPDGTPITPYQDTKAWKALLAEAKVPHVPQHTMRHSAASLMQRAGVDESTRMALMGHSSAVAQQGYIHIDQTAGRKALESLDGLIG